MSRTRSSSGDDVLSWLGGGCSGGASGCAADCRHPPLQIAETSMNATVQRIIIPFLSQAAASLGPLVDRDHFSAHRLAHVLAEGPVKAVILQLLEHMGA